MPSTAHSKWFSARSAELDQIESAHSKVGGTGPGRRYTTQQINHAYAMLLSSHFQGFCRELHSEAVDFIVSNLQPANVRSVVQVELSRDRKLDKGNPNPGNVGADFGRLGFDLWPTAYAHVQVNAGRNARLEELNEWRNAIAHQDFKKLGGGTLGIQQVRRWRQTCNGLVQTFDSIVARQVATLVGSSPW